MTCMKNVFVAWMENNKKPNHTNSSLMIKAPAVAAALKKKTKRSGSRSRRALVSFKLGPHKFMWKKPTQASRQCI